MAALVGLVVMDYLRSWRIAVELALLLVFYELVKSWDRLTPIEAIQATTFLSIVVVPFTVRRMTNRAWSPRSRYLIATGQNRRGYFLALVLGSLLIDFIVIAAALAITVPRWVKFDPGSLTAPAVLLVSIILVSTAIYAAFSRLTSPRYGSAVAVALVLALSFGDTAALRYPAAKQALSAAQQYGPRLRDALDIISKNRDSGGWSLVAIELCIYAGLFIAFALWLFSSKELIFED